ncbi:M23 family metallopeptidase [Aestuariibacter sp. AA17]|uniref:M23 family metallopeptidase n=2 Tax=Fluctibacter corallii TaxID=2984329 RepID=A0ABT3A9G0_9ALTE|nr:M23 family metallopeptidase [Aestuariibacter sp. AA17]MCV2885245.1 M23 family metallopeptidase [Aestuariibacter sp. AA17]
MFGANIGQAQDLVLEGERTQGSLLRGKVAPNAKVFLNDTQVKVSSDGYFAIGFGRDAPLTHTLKVALDEQQPRVHTITLSEREYDIQHIEGLPPKMVTPPEEVLKRIRQDNQQVANARRTDDDRVDFMGQFVWPAEGRISGVYGSQRVLNGKPKRPHFGVDVAGPVGTPVHAPADGIITLWVPDMYYSGGTMIIDHGHGVSSTFLHLSKGHVEAGDTVKQGQLVGEIGATGRATGPHLDWRINWFKERLDPALLVPKR